MVRGRCDRRARRRDRKLRRKFSCVAQLDKYGGGSQHRDNSHRERYG